ncbi:MAG TPA: TGS domain-containing protein [Lentimicrobium sp.]|nr:TGS domain-containing protein [Lentimicrobium sp.]
MKTQTTYRELLLACLPTAGNKDKTLIRKAYEIACREYSGFTSASNEPLIEYSNKLVKIVTNELNLGFTSAISALLCYTDNRHDFVSQYLHENKLIEVSTIIESFRKINELPTERIIENADNYTGIMLAMTSDVRAILIALADNLCLLRSADKMNKQNLNNTLIKAANIYIPLAHRLGIYKIKSELEEITFKLKEPRTYNDLALKIQTEVNRSGDFIKKFTEPIITDLDRMDLRYSLKSRTKSVSSVHNKMLKQKVSFNEVYDLFAIRIITESNAEDEKADCWKVYSIVTNLYTPETSRMRDWITLPRANGYESLHITVKDKSGRWVEVQIRSQRMDRDAELGTAAHWIYKGRKTGQDTTGWLNNIREILENPNRIEESLTDDSIVSKIPDNIIYVFTPAGDLIKLKEGSTVLDFAFELHSVIGSRCSGGRVNHKLVPIRQKLKNGDMVEIITSKNQTPNRDWLLWVTTSRAKSKIKRYLKEAEFKQAEVGKDILRRKLSQLKLPYNDETVNKLIGHFKFDTALELYQQLADNKIETSQVKEILLGPVNLSGIAKEAPEASSPKELTKHHDRTSENTILVNETAELQGYILARCCNPVMGDEIFGFVMNGGGIKIHRITCPNAHRLRTRFPYRIMAAQWSKVAEGSYFISSLHISGIDQLGILNSITELLSNEMKVDVRNIAFKSKEGKFEGFLKISVRDSKHIDSLIKKIESLKGVTRVRRMN